MTLYCLTSLNVYLQTGKDGEQPINNQPSFVDNKGGTGMCLTRNDGLKTNSEAQSEKRLSKIPPKPQRKRSERRASNLGQGLI